MIVKNWFVVTGFSGLNKEPQINFGHHIRPVQRIHTSVVAAKNAVIHFKKGLPYNQYAKLF